MAIFSSIIEKDSKKFCHAFLPRSLQSWSMPLRMHLVYLSKRLFMETLLGIEEVFSVFNTVSILVKRDLQWKRNEEVRTLEGNLLAQ